MDEYNQIYILFAICLTIIVIALYQIIKSFFAYDPLKEIMKNKKAYIAGKTLDAPIFGKYLSTTFPDDKGNTFGSNFMIIDYKTMPYLSIFSDKEGVNKVSRTYKGKYEYLYGQWNVFEIDLDFLSEILAKRVDGFYINHHLTNQKIISSKQLLDRIEKCKPARKMLNIF